MNYTKSRWFGYSLITLTYLLAGFLGILVYNKLSYAFWINLLIADVISTIFVFLISVITRNASVYDPYWSVQPVFIILAFLLTYGFNIIGVIILCIVSLWGIRLTANWAYTFTGMKHEDWRYVQLKKQSGYFYPLVNLFGIHLVPTLVVYGCTLPAVFLIYYKASFNWLAVIPCLISVGAIIIQTTSDIQMHKFRKQQSKGLIRVGLWKYSRHPNYLGEILMWWGVALTLVISLPSKWYLIIGAIANTLLFLFISIPMAEKRQSNKEGFSQYKKETRMLLPIKK